MIVIYIHSRGKYEFHSWTTVTTIKPNVKLPIYFIHLCCRGFYHLQIRIRKHSKRFVQRNPPNLSYLFLPSMANCSVTFFVELQDVVVNWKPLTKGIILFFNHTIPLRRAPCKSIQVLSFSSIFCPSSCHSKIQIPDHLLKLVLNLYAFSANAARIKRQTSMKTKLFCSNRRNQLNVEDVRLANQEQEFLALDQSWASNFALFSSKIKDGAYYCYCAYVLRISRYSDFLSVMLTNTGVFLRSLKLPGESRS